MIFKKARFASVLHENYYINSIFINLPFNDQTFKNIIQVLNGTYYFDAITDDFLKNVTLMNIQGLNYNILIEKLKKYYLNNEIKSNIISEIIDCRQISTDILISFLNSVVDKLNEPNIELIENKLNSKKINGKNIVFRITDSDAQCVSLRLHCQNGSDFDFGLWHGGSQRWPALI